MSDRRSGSEQPPHDREPSRVREDRLVAAMEEYRQAFEAGRPINQQQFLQRFPDIADELADCLAGMEIIQVVASQINVANVEASTASEPSTHIRQNLGDFRIKRELGRGGMGVVYEAEQLSLGRRVALKILPFAALLNEHQLERFAREATAAARLQHSHIVPIYAVGCERGIHFYSMQLIEGPSLAEVIAEMRRERHPRDEEQLSTDTVVAKQAGLLTRDEDGGHYLAVARIGRDAAEALHYAHENGVLHRDIKPSNLLLDKSGHVWIADFGLARVEDESQLTRTGDILGTLRYMSPEQATGERVDTRSDVYSLGATLYELATLQPVFDSENRGVVVKQVLAANPLAPRKVDGRIPKPLSYVISKSMARLDERYQSAQELADDLRRFLDGEAVYARRPHSLRRAHAFMYRHPITAALFSIVLCLSVVLIAHLIGTHGLRRLSIGPPHQFSAADNRDQLNNQQVPVGIEIAIDDVTVEEGEHFFDVFVSSGDGLLNHPTVLLFGPDSNEDDVEDLYVSSARTNEVLRYDGKTGAFLDVVVGDDTATPDVDETGGLQFPNGLTFDERGRLYVASRATNQIFRYDIMTRTRDSGFLVSDDPATADVDESGGLRTSAHMRLGPDANNDGIQDLYVASVESDQVLLYDGVSGAFIDVFVGEDPRTVTLENGGLAGPIGMAFEDVDGNGVDELYVGSRTGDVLYYDSLTGKFLGRFVSAGAAGIGGIGSLVFEPNGDLYAHVHRPPDGILTEVYRFGRASENPAAVVVPNGSGGLINSWDLTLGPEGNLYVTGSISGSVLRYSPNPVAVVKVRLSASNSEEVRVDYQSHDGTAVGGTDYTDVSGTLTFAPRETSRTITVPTIHDDYSEGNESFSIRLRNPVGAVIANEIGTVTIIDSD